MDLFRFFAFAKQRLDRTGISCCSFARYGRSVAAAAAGRPWRVARPRQSSRGPVQYIQHNHVSTCYLRFCGNSTAAALHSTRPRAEPPRPTTSAAAQHRHWMRAALQQPAPDRQPVLALALLRSVRCVHSTALLFSCCLHILRGKNIIFYCFIPPAVCVAYNIYAYNNQ